MLEIAIFQSDLNTGGIQRSLLAVLSYLKDKPVHIDLYLFRRIRLEGLNIPGNVRVIQHTRFSFMLRFLPFSLAHVLSKPVETTKNYDLSIDFNSYWHECAHGALSVRAVRRICWIHSDLKLRYALNWKYRLLWLFSHSKFGSFDAFAAVSKGAADSFADLSGISREHISIVPNLIDISMIVSGSREKIDLTVDPSLYNLVSVGSMNYYKGFDILVQLMSDIVRKRPDTRLYIIGDGPSRKDIEQMVKRLDLTHYVFFLGSRPNPYPFLAHMDGFITTSRYEGQGIAVMEALALELDVFIPRHLERYLDGVQGYDNLVEAIVRAPKRHVHYDFEAYNKHVREQLNLLLGIER